MLNTIDEIVNDILKYWTASNMDKFRSLKLDEARANHHSFGMWIRNHYSLWHESPLTEKWRTDETSHVIKNDVDYSEDHPDVVSDKIIVRLWHKLQDWS